MAAAASPSRLVFRTGTVCSYKTTHLLAQRYAYNRSAVKPTDPRPWLIKPALDSRQAVVWSRIPGMSSPPDATLAPTESVLERFATVPGPICAVFVDECQFLTLPQIRELWDLSFRVPVFAYGLSTDWHGKLFPASAELLSLADRTEWLEAPCCFCHSGDARFNVRVATSAPPAVAPGVDFPLETGDEATFLPACKVCFRARRK